jgi:hypothetical protein
MAAGPREGGRPACVFAFVYAWAFVCTGAPVPVKEGHGVVEVHGAGVGVHARQVHGQDRGQVLRTLPRVITQHLHTGAPQGARMSVLLSLGTQGRRTRDRQTRPTCHEMR